MIRMSFSEAITLETKEQGIERAMENANPMWKDEALRTILKLCDRNATFSADDIINDLEAHGIFTHNLGALAGVFKKAASLGYCQMAICACCDTPRTIESTRKKSHKRRISLWKSVV